MLCGSPFATMICLAPSTASLRVVALDEAVLGQEHAAVGIGTLRCTLGSGSFEGGRGTGPERLRFSALRSPPPRFRLRLSPPQADAASASSASLASRILAKRFCLSAIQPGISSPRRLAPWSLSSCASAASCSFKPAIHFGAKLRLTRLHAFVAHRLVSGGVRLDLRAVERDMPQLRQPGFFRKLQHLQKTASPAAAADDAASRKSAISAKIWRVAAPRSS